MADLEETTILSLRVADLDEPAPGSVELPCARCQEPTWASVSAMPLIVQGAELVCMHCTTRAELSGQLEVPPGAMEEIEMMEGRAARRRMERVVRMHNRRQFRP